MGNSANSERIITTDDPSHQPYQPTLPEIDDALAAFPSPFSTDFSTLEREEYRLKAAANAPLTWNHPTRDRWSNPFTIDSSRVKLSPPPDSPLDSPFDDYIAANFVRQDPRSLLSPAAAALAFIASQAPLPETFGHFWSMVWDQGTSRIFMLTQLEESGRVKAHQYWPDAASPLLHFGAFSVALSAPASRDPASQADVHSLLLRREGCPEPRPVTLYQYTEWPDHSVPTPDKVSQVASLVEAALSEHDARAPAVVHCSAGAGRTGVFIATAFEAQRFLTLGDQEDPRQVPLTVYHTIAHMRTQRRHMVQELSQYKFIFTLIAHILKGRHPNWF